MMIYVMILADTDRQEHTHRESQAETDTRRRTDNGVVRRNLFIWVRPFQLTAGGSVLSDDPPRKSPFSKWDQ